MTENDKMNGWTIEETLKTAENLMDSETDIFKWDVLRHLSDFAEAFLEELQQYRAIGTLEECRAAMEKQKAKKPMHVTNSYFGYQKHKEHVGYCPDCGHQVEETYGCPNCLRKIDWSDEE